MKKLLSIALALLLVLGLTAIAKPASADGEEITLWTYPVGTGVNGWGNEEAVKAMTDAFTAETGIKVKVEYLSYTDGDDKVNTALTAKAAPDLILEGPERLVANWGAQGYMVNIADLYDDQDKAEINGAAVAACFADENTAYEYPICTVAHCMAINLDAFKAAGADQYINLETRTWTTEDFINAVKALYAYYGDTVGIVFCGGQGGDQGTRALVNNLYGGTFANAEHTAYTWDDPLNIKALKALYDLEGIEFDSSAVGGDEQNLFYNGTLKMAFCWNAGAQLNETVGAGKTAAGEEIAYVNFPSQDGTPILQGGIWGFGIVNNGDEAKIEAAKKFIKFMCDSDYTANAVPAGFFAARTAVAGETLSVWADDPVLTEYAAKILPHLGDYYQVTKGWAPARTAWWNMLQQVGASDGSEAAITAAVAEYCGQANAN